MNMASLEHIRQTVKPWLMFFPFILVATLVWGCADERGYPRIASVQHISKPYHVDVETVNLYEKLLQDRQNAETLKQSVIQGHPPDFASSSKPAPKLTYVDTLIVSENSIENSLRMVMPKLDPYRGTLHKLHFIGFYSTDMINIQEKILVNMAGQQGFFMDQLIVAALPAPAGGVVDRSSISIFVESTDASTNH